MEADTCSNLVSLQLLNERKALGLSQKDISDKSGLSISTIQRIEHPKECCNASLTNILKYATALNLNIYLQH